MSKEIMCPKCGSLETRKHGLKILAGGRKAQMFQCKACGSHFRSKEVERVSEPYRYVRFRWWERVDLEKVSEDLKKSFTVTIVDLPIDPLSLHADKRRELKVSADTLHAILSIFSGTLYQKEAAPFTPRDVELRKTVLELYPRTRSTPLPWIFMQEPKFETT